jgi:hypothetical protein
MTFELLGRHLGVAVLHHHGQRLVEAVDLLEHPTSRRRTLAGSGLAERHDVEQRAAEVVEPLLVTRVGQALDRVAESVDVGRDAGVESVEPLVQRRDIEPSMSSRAAVYCSIVPGAGAIASSRAETAVPSTASPAATPAALPRVPMFDASRGIVSFSVWNAL